MQLYRFFLIVIATLIMMDWQFWRLNFSTPITTSQAWAQTPNSRQTEAERLFQEAKQLFEKGQVESALQSWQQALVIYQELNDRRGQVLTLLQLGIAYEKLFNYQQAIKHLEALLPIAKAINERKLLAVALEVLGNSYKEQEDYARAKDYLQQSLALIREINNPPWEAEILNNLGLVYCAEGNYKQGIEYYQQALIITREVQENEAETLILNNLGVAYHFSGDLDQAIKSYQQSLILAQKIKNLDLEAKSLNNLGSIYEDRKDYAQAIKYYQQSLAVKQKIRDRRGEGITLGNLGNVYREQGNYRQAIELYQQSLAIAQELNNQSEVRRALGNLAYAYLISNNYGKALDYYQQSLMLAKSIKNLSEECDALNGLGLAYIYLGDYAKALDYYNQSLAITEQLKDPSKKGKVFNGLGMIYFFLGNYQKAIDFHQMALTIAKESRDFLGEGQALGNLAVVYRTQKDYAKAIDYHQQSLVIFRKLKNRRDEGIALTLLGNVYREMRDSQKAIDYYQQSLVIAREINDRDTEGKALGNLGSIYSYLGKLSLAIEYQKMSLAIARERKDPVEEAVALDNLGLDFFQASNFAAAEKALYDAIEIWESIRYKLGSDDINKISIFERQALTYQKLQEILVSQDKTEASLEVAERGRARAFLDFLISRLSPYIKQQDLVSLKNQVASPNIQQIKQIAQNHNSTLVQYSILFNKYLYIWVVSPEGKVWLHQTDLKKSLDISLLNLVLKSRESIDVGRGRTSSIIREQISRVDQTEHLKQLHKILIAPIADFLPSDPNAHVIFMPQGELFLVPFAALQDEDGKYLIEKHTILTAPAIQVLDLTQQQRLKVQQANSQGIVIVGNPTMPKVTVKIGETPEQLKPLPASQEEAIAIAEIFKTKSLTGNQASKAAILSKLSQARIVHLATHGLLDDFMGLGVPGAIALAPSGTGELNDGLLTANEILDLKLNAELVVLSACDTGRGRITGDGVIGLSRSLISAGVPSVMVSLWSVPDAPTAELMTQFYRNWLSGKLDKAQALRQAMLTIMKSHPRPKDWAAFTLIGEAE